MGFGLSIGNGTFLPFVKINGKDGKVERSTYDGTNRGIEIISDLVALFDWKTLKTGWVHFADSGAPDKQLVAIGDPMPDRPSIAHKQGIQVIILLPGGLGLHEICTTATGVVSALEQVYDLSMEAPEWGGDKVPVIRLTKFTKEGSGLKARTVPTFEIIDWKDRPADFEPHAALPRPRATVGSAAGTRPAATGSTAMTPAPAAQKQLATPDFG